MSKTFEATAEGLVEFVKDCLASPNIYIWGGIGEYLTDSVLDDKIRQWPEWYTPELTRVRREMVNRGLRGWDCHGLIQCYRWGNYHQGNTVYFKEEEFFSSSQLIQMDLVKGDIATLPEKPGLVLWMPGHVGVYIGGGEVIECTRRIIGGEGYGLVGGVVKTNVSDVGWEKWLEYPGIRYDS